MQWTISLNKHVLCSIDYQKINWNQFQKSKLINTFALNTLTKQAF